MDKKEKALELFNNGFSCSQAVFAVFAEELGLDMEQALKISGAFGGGIVGMGKTCGAVTGAYMAIGLKYGKFKSDDSAAKEKTYAIAKELNSVYDILHGSIECKDLLGVDLSTPEGAQKAKEENLTRKICPKLVADSVEALNRLL